MIALAAAIAMLCLAVGFCLVLEVARIRWEVPTDAREAAVLEALPGANCGGCGYPGCARFARAVLAGEAPVEGCNLGGSAVAARVAAVLGVVARESHPVRPVIHCAATAAQRLGRATYDGEQTCAAAAEIGGVQGCTYGCLGLGDCVAACEYDAIHMVDGLPRIDYEKCVGCGACVTACPRQIIEQIPFRHAQMLVVGCSNPDPGRAVRAVCEVGCIGCQRCEREAPGTFRIGGGLAHIDYRTEGDPEALERARKACPMQSLVLMGIPPHPIAGDPPLKTPTPPAAAADGLAWRG